MLQKNKNIHTPRNSGVYCSPPGFLLELFVSVSQIKMISLEYTGQIC